jgi:hypothetical protein
MKALSALVGRTASRVACIVLALMSSGRLLAYDFHLVISDKPLRNAIVGQPYYAVIEMSAGLPPVAWEALSLLPPGCSIQADVDDRHLVLSGTPSLAGLFPIALHAADRRGDSAVATLVLHVVQLPEEVLADAGGNPDGDRYPSLVEYSLGTAPLVPNFGPTAPSIEMSRTPEGAPLLLVPARPDTTEIYREIQIWDATAGHWMPGVVDPPLTGPLLSITLPHGDGSAPLLARILCAVPVTKEQRIGDMIEEINKLAEAVKDASDELEGNPLVEEVRLIRLIQALLSTPDEIKSLFEKWLKDDLIPDWDALSDEDAEKVAGEMNKNIEKIKAALCYAQELLEFLADFDTARKDQLETAAENIERLKQLLEQRQDIEAFYREFRKSLEDLQKLLKEKAADYLKEKLADTLKKRLIQKFGPAAAAAIVSAATDAFNFIKLLIAQGKLAEAKKLYYLMFFDMLALTYQCPKYHIDCEKWNTDAHNPRIQFADCQAVTGKKVEVRACLRCWEQKPGGAPNEGSFREVAVPFAGGSQTITRNPFSSEVAGECAVKFRLDWTAFAAAAANNCPHAHLMLKVDVDGKRSVVYGGAYAP